MLGVQSLEQDAAELKLALMEKEDMLASLASEFEGLIPKLHGYIDAREHLLTMTVKEKTGEAYQQLELSLRNEQRENAWMKRALQENKRKRADRLSRLQQQVTLDRRSLHMLIHIKSHSLFSSLSSALWSF